MRLSKAFYVGSIAGGLGLGFLVIAITVVLMIGLGGNISEDEAALAIVPAALFMFYGAIVLLILWYKAWEAIQDGQVRTTPGKAVGFLFIPFFNLYWIFEAFHGFAKDYNSYVDRHSLGVAKLPAGMFLAYCVLVLGGLIPIIGPLFSLAALGVMIVLSAKVCDAVNGLPGRTATP